MKINLEEAYDSYKRIKQDRNLERSKYINIYELIFNYFKNKFYNPRTNNYHIEITREALQEMIIPELAGEIAKLVEERPGTWKYQNSPGIEVMQQALKAELEFTQQERVKDDINQN